MLAVSTFFLCEQGFFFLREHRGVNRATTMVGSSVKWIIPRLSSRLPDEMGWKAPAGVPSTPRKWFPLALSGAVCRATSTKIYELKLELNVQLSDSAPCRPYRWVKFGLYREPDGSLPAGACPLALTSPGKKKKKKNWCTVGKKKKSYTRRRTDDCVHTRRVQTFFGGKKKGGPSLQWWSCSAGTTEEEVMVQQDRLEFQLSSSSRSRRQLCNNGTQLQKENRDREEEKLWW